MKRHSAILPATICVLLIVAATDSTQAQVVPFKARGVEAIYTPDDGNTSGPGNATHMGAVFGSGLALPTADLGNGLFEWTALNYQLTAANGDQIFFYGGGLVQFIPLGGDQFTAIWSGEFYVDGGTGRFRNVKGADEPIDVTATNDPFTLQADGSPVPGDTWTYSWTLEGQINLGRRRR